MKAKVNFKVGSVVYQLELEEKDEMETLNKMITLANPPRKCDECGETADRLVSNKDKEGNTYVSVKCDNCEAKAKLGQYKTGGFFWHRFEKYVKPTTPKLTDKEEEDDEEISIPDEID